MHVPAFALFDSIMQYVHLFTYTLIVGWKVTVVLFKVVNHGFEVSMWIFLTFLQYLFFKLNIYLCRPTGIYLSTYNNINITSFYCKIREKIVYELNGIQSVFYTFIIDDTIIIMPDELKISIRQTTIMYLIVIHCWINSYRNFYFLPTVLYVLICWKLCIEGFHSLIFSLHCLYMIPLQSRFISFSFNRNAGWIFSMAP